MKKILIFVSAFIICCCSGGRACDKDKKSVQWEVFNVSGYCAKCSKCVSRRYRDGRTASGKRVKWGYMAAGKQYHFGTRIEFKTAIRGRKVFEVQDRGRVIKGNKLDILFDDQHGGHRGALKFGRKRLYARIIN